MARLQGLEGRVISDLFSHSYHSWNWDDEGKFIWNGLEEMRFNIPPELNCPSLTHLWYWIKKLGWDAETRFNRIVVKAEQWREFESEEEVFSRPNCYTLREIFTLGYKALAMMMGRTQLRKRTVFYAEVGRKTVILTGNCSDYSEYLDSVYRYR